MHPVVCIQKNGKTKAKLKNLSRRDKKILKRLQKIILTATDWRMPRFHCCPLRYPFEQAKGLGIGPLIKKIYPLIEIELINNEEILVLSIGKIDSFFKNIFHFLAIHFNSEALWCRNQFEGIGQLLFIAQNNSSI